MAAKATTSKKRKGYLEFRVRVLTSATTELSGTPPKTVRATKPTPMVVEEVTLYYTNLAENSDKIYIVRIVLDSVRVGTEYSVQFEYGKRGSTKLTPGTRTLTGVSASKASQIFDALVNEKKAKGYTTNKSGKPFS